MKIKEWAVEDRPREKLYQKGSKTLSNVELLAILLGTGTKSESAIDLSRSLLAQADNNLNNLGKMNHSELCKIKGIGKAKATIVMAGLELANRRRNSLEKQKPIVSDSFSAFEVLRPYFFDLNLEEFWVLYLNKRNQVLAKKRISIGGVSGTYVDLKVVFRHAFEIYATSIIVAHNHPSGNMKPSQADIHLTKRIREGAEFLDMKLFDHLIISQNQYFSFADSGLIGD